MRACQQQRPRRLLPIPSPLKESFFSTAAAAGRLPVVWPVPPVSRPGRTRHVACVAGRLRLLLGLVQFVERLRPGAKFLGGKSVGVMNGQLLRQRQLRTRWHTLACPPRMRAHGDASEPRRMRCALAIPGWSASYGARQSCPSLNQCRRRTFNLSGCRHHSDGQANRAGGAL